MWARPAHLHPFHRRHLDGAAAGLRAAGSSIRRGTRAARDVVFCELSGTWWITPGQVLRSFTVGAEPTPLYRDLHAAAEAAFDAVTASVRHGATMQEIVDAAGVIEERGFHGVR